MKDTVGFLLALLFAGNGVNLFIKPERFLKPYSDRREFKIKRLKILGVSLFCLGLILLALCI